MRRKFVRAIVAAFVAWSGAAAPELAAQQTGTVQGSVVDAISGRPLASAQVGIDGTQFNTVANAQGRFQFVGVPAGQYTIRVSLIGYGDDQTSVGVEAGRLTNVIFRLQETAVQLQEIVVTGVGGATQKAKLPFVVDKVNADALPVPAASAGSAIQGKVAGARVVSGSGRPGEAPSILLRGATSINASNRSQEPLYIVDGVILGASIVDIDALDIENVEVVKGAAAASLYGSRAANGVIQITTKRGSRGTVDSNRYTFRSEYGMSDVERSISIAQNHKYRLNADGSKFVRGSGSSTVEFDWLEGGNNFAQRRQPVQDCGNLAQTSCNAWNVYQDNEWPGGTYDHLERFFDPGNFLQSYLGVEGRAGGTRYHVSFSNMKQDGVLIGQEGFNRNNFRLNLDQGIRDNLQISANTFYSKSSQDAIGGGGGAFFTLTRMPAGVDLMARDSAGELIIRPDHTGENANPIYELLNRDFTQNRERFMGSATLRYTPVNWVDFDANFSYDRLSQVQRDYFPKGYRTPTTSTLNLGTLDINDAKTEAFNASVRATFRRSFGPVNTRSVLNYLVEDQRVSSQRGLGQNFTVQDVPTLTATRDGRIPRSNAQRIAAEGYSASTALDIADRYVIDALIRRDGSSLFGADERWHTYYRGAFAWRVSEEAFFEGLKETFPELKLRYSLGTAGNRPSFAAQYETFNVADGGVLTPTQLGNRKLKPEYVVEHEAGIDLTALNGITLGVTYAKTDAQDQMIPVPLPAYSGFVNQWKNAGTLSSKTWEASLDFPILQREDLKWSGRVLFDRTTSTITKLNVPAFQFGVPQQGLENVFFAREGEVFGTFYGTRWATQCSELPSGVNCSEFQVNDDGYLVWVGANGSWKGGAGPDGQLQTADDLWGRPGPQVRGAAVLWGAPIPAQDAEGNTFLPLGNSTPDFNFSVSNNFSYKNFSVYALVDASLGFEVYNLPRQWAYFEDYHADQDQAGKPDELKKPTGYYGSNGLYRQLSPPNSHFVEDGSFVKLRELAFRYNFGRTALSRLPFASGIDNLGLSLVGRNLLTFTDYTGFDPEVGNGGGQVGSSAIARFDGFYYPNFRTWTAAVELNF